MKKKWLVIICIVFGLLVICGMGSHSDKASNNSDDHKSLYDRTTWVTISEFEDFAKSKNFLFVDAIVHSVTEGSIYVGSLDEFESVITSNANTVNYVVIGYYDVGVSTEKLAVIVTVG